MVAQALNEVLCPHLWNCVGAAVGKTHGFWKARYLYFFIFDKCLSCGRRSRNKWLSFEHKNRNCHWCPWF